MSEYMKFVKWDGENAIFTKCSILDVFVAYSGIADLCRLLDISEGNIIVIKIPKALKNLRQK